MAIDTHYYVVYGSVVFVVALVTVDCGVARKIFRGRGEEVWRRKSPSGV